MKRFKLVALLLAVVILGVSSCTQAACPAYTKADMEYQKDVKKARF
ncbi:hypothetical protein [Roseivirga echinicomitans]|nr:hypothetical protein [Roseivirga echinicomitans]